MVYDYRKDVMKKNPVIPENFSIIHVGNDDVLERSNYIPVGCVGAYRQQTI